MTPMTVKGCAIELQRLYRPPQGRPPNRRCHNPSLSTIDPVRAPLLVGVRKHPAVQRLTLENGPQARGYPSSRGGRSGRSEPVTL